MLKDFISERLLATGKSWDYLVSRGYISHITRYRIQRGDYEDPSKKRMHSETKQKLALALQCTQGDIEDALSKTAEPKDTQDVETEKAPETTATGCSQEEREDLVNHPAHYQMAGGLEVIDFIEAAVANMSGPEAYTAGNVLKYVCRYRKKGGVESLKKARWYLDRLIKLKAGQNERVNS